MLALSAMPLPRRPAAKATGGRSLSSAKIMQTSAMKTRFQIAECSLSSAKIMQTSAMKTRFQIAECSLSSAKIMVLGYSAKQNCGIYSARSKKPAPHWGASAQRHTPRRAQKAPAHRAQGLGQTCLRAASGTRTRTAITGQGILSPSCLPIPPLRQCRHYRLQRYYNLS